MITQSTLRNTYELEDGEILDEPEEEGYAQQEDERADGENDEG